MVVIHLDSLVTLPNVSASADTRTALQDRRQPVVRIEPHSSVLPIVAVALGMPIWHVSQRETLRHSLETSSPGSSPLFAPPTTTDLENTNLVAMSALSEANMRHPGGAGMSCPIEGLATAYISGRSCPSKYNHPPAAGSRTPHIASARCEHRQYCCVPRPTAGWCACTIRLACTS